MYSFLIQTTTAHFPLYKKKIEVHKILTMIDEVVSKEVHVGASTRAQRNEIQRKLAPV